MPVELDDIPSVDSAEQQRRENRKSRFRLIRTERNVRRRDIAEELGVTRHTWTRWERHGDEPDETNLERLHQLTGREYTWLRGE